MHNLDLILTLTSGLAAALVLGYTTQRLGLSPIVGYLLAGIAVGPYTPGFVADRALAEQLAEVGVILLMFGVGLHFQIKELVAVRRIALPGAIGQSTVATLLGVAAGVGFGWGWKAGLVFGLAISVASTVVLARILADNNDLHTQTGHIAVGWLVVEDLFTVVVLVVLPALFGGEGTRSQWIGWVLGLALLKIAVMVGVTVLVGGRLVPWLLSRVALTRSRELFSLTILVLALGIAVGSAKLFGVSMALGAFLAGMIVGRSEFSLRAASEALPLRDAFAVLFFVSVGMLFDPRIFWQSPSVVLATLAIVLVGKPLAAVAIVLGLGYPVRTAVAVAIALAQVGEFSFILVTLGTGLGILPQSAASAIIAAAIVSISLNPLLYRWRTSLAVGGWLERSLGFLVRAQATEPGAGEVPPVDVRVRSRDRWHRAVVVGYGPVGQTVTRLLQENGIEPTVVELNLETVRRLRTEGIDAVYGDAGQREVMEGAGMAGAGSLILGASGLGKAEELVRLARELNPRIRILARSAYVRESSTLHEAGADTVFSGEGEVALAFTEALLLDLGATPEQVDRERARVRREMLAKAP